MEAPKATQRDNARVGTRESPKGRSSAIAQSSADADAAAAVGRRVGGGQRPRASGTELQRRWREEGGGRRREAGGSLYECVRVMMIESELAADTVRRV